MNIKMVKYYSKDLHVLVDFPNYNKKQIREYSTLFSGPANANTHPKQIYLRLDLTEEYAPSIEKGELDKDDCVITYVFDVTKHNKSSLQLRKAFNDWLDCILDEHLEVMLNDRA